MNCACCFLFALKSSVAERWREVNSGDGLISSSGHRVICDWRFVIGPSAHRVSLDFRISSFHFRFVIFELSKLIHVLT
jgi:hypothetical protein